MRGFGKFFIVFLSFVCFGLFVCMIDVSASGARQAECDACGYCQNQKPPGNWEKCRDCLYPQFVGFSPEDGRTLEIILTPSLNPNNPNRLIVNVPVPPAEGKFYSQLGCIDTSANSFRDPAAAGGVLNFILTRLIFPSVGVLAFMALIYAAFLLMTAQDDEVKIQQGKQYLTGALVGLLFTFGMVFIINTIGGSILRIPGFGIGARISIVVGGNIAQNPPPNNSYEYPIMNVYINTLDRKMKSFQKVIGNRAQTDTRIGVPNDEEFANYDLAGPPPDEIQSVIVELANDNFAQINNGSGDVNLFIKSVAIDGVGLLNCQKVEDWHPPGSPPNQYFPTTLPATLYGVGRIQCFK